jgi:hypothetical protein
MSRPIVADVRHSPKESWMCWVIDYRDNGRTEVSGRYPSRKMAQRMAVTAYARDGVTDVTVRCEHQRRLADALVADQTAAC